ncbi:hypothetical protein evm_002886 [Chilo suppressalis]|nr:hypothetical protein evm_002886 [Chilo suppressalis]
MRCIVTIAVSFSSHHKLSLYSHLALVALIFHCDMCLPHAQASPQFGLRKHLARKNCTLCALPHGTDTKVVNAGKITCVVESRNNVLVVIKTPRLETLKKEPKNGDNYVFFEEFDGRGEEHVEVIGWVTKTCYFELLRASEGTLRRWSRLCLHSLAAHHSALGSSVGAARYCINLHVNGPFGYWGFNLKSKVKAETWYNWNVNNRYL